MITITSFSLLILTNLKFKEDFIIFKDLKDWLEQSNQLLNSNDESFIQLRDQLCAGFFLIYCKKCEISLKYLDQIKGLVVPEYFEALKEEVQKRQNIDDDDAKDHVEDLKIRKGSSSAYIRGNIYEYSWDVVLNFWSFLAKFATGILDKMKTRHRLLVNLIQSNSKNFLLFCQKLLKVLLIKLRIL